MKKDVMFRGCTRPPMFMGVPYIPFFIGAGGGLLMAMYFNFWLLLLIPISIFTMRQMAKRDEMIFQLLGLRLQFKFRARSREEFPGMWCFSANKYRDRPASK